MTSNTIVLVQPPMEDYYLTRKRTVPYGLASIAAHLIAAGFNVKIIDGLASKKTKKIKPPASFSYLEPYYPEKDMTRFNSIVKDHTKMSTTPIPPFK